MRPPICCRKSGKNERYLKNLFEKIPPENAIAIAISIALWNKYSETFREERFGQEIHLLRKWKIDVGVLPGISKTAFSRPSVLLAFLALLIIVSFYLIRRDVC